VDAEGERIRDEMFAPGRESELIQAVSFEEMETLVALGEPAIESPVDNDEAAHDLEDDAVAAG
jgi:hypothetical protein